MWRASSAERFDGALSAKPFPPGGIRAGCGRITDPEAIEIAAILQAQGDMK
jgi:hypothetical protein